MKEPYGEGLASHTGPESCVAARKGRREALTGVSAGRVLSRERIVRLGRRRCAIKRKATRTGTLRGECRARPHVVRDPAHAQTLPAREPGDPPFVRGARPADRIGKATAWSR